MRNYTNTDEGLWLSTRDLAGEIWKDIDGFSGVYMVSNYGRIKSLDRTVPWRFGRTMKCHGQILKYKKSRGYDSVGLYHNDIGKYMRVSRLVAMAFIPNPDNLPQVNHKDCNVHNNSVENLEWCTAKYNCNYADHNLKLSISSKRRFLNPESRDEISLMQKRMWENPTRRMLDNLRSMCSNNCKRVYQIDSDGNIIHEYSSANEAFRQTGIHSQNIGQVCLGRNATAGGFKWRYI